MEIEGDIQMALSGPGQVGELVGASSHTPKKVAGLISSQGTYLGCRLIPSWGTCRRQPTDASLSLSLSPLLLPLSLNPISISSSEDK